MPDDAEFLAAICAHPDDDGLRLVYADWLEEHGECERRDFIGRQISSEPCKLKKAQTDAWFGHIIKPLCRGYEIRNLPTSCYLWFLDARGSAIIRRGFVEEIACRWEDWGGGACRACRHGQQIIEHVFRGADQVCSCCSGTGRTPGHAAAILAATPLRKVRLTTGPDYEEQTIGSIGPRPAGYHPPRRLDGRQRWWSWEELGSNIDPPTVIKRLLAAEWPGIEFELPAPPAIGTAVGDSYRVGNREYVDVLLTPPG